VFCGQCGARLIEPSAPTLQGAPGFTSARSYPPKHLAEKILASKTALEGERKHVTVLFADLKGSMALLADRDPEEARKLLDPVLEHMMEAVHQYEGTVNQVMGDGIMALFGAPLAHEDHAVRACYAALRMQESVMRYAEGVRRENGVTVRIRVGLNSGEVVVRAIGSDLRMDYTAVGQTTHLAARMEQLAEPGSILLSPATLALAEGYVEVKPLGRLPVKGLPEPVEVCELVGAGAVRSRLHAAAARGLTRFVGRDGEVDQLRNALERAQAGHGQVVGVVGEPGVGKSRLYWEFTHSHRTHGWLILESGSVSYGKATAYLPVIDLLKEYFHIEGRDETRTIREKVTDKVLSLDRALEPSLSALLALLEVPLEDEAWRRLDPAQRRQRTLDAVKRLLLQESLVQPLMLLVEDLHWIDAETQALLDSLVESLPTARLLLLTNYRPEYQHRWGSKTYYRQLRIDPLPAESADDLLTSLLGTEASLDVLKRTLIERTEGNPLFLEESVRTLAETSVLTGERGAYRLAHDAGAIQMPATVQAILAARIDRLLPDDKRLLQAAAVIGKDVPFALLFAVAELPEEDVRRGLADLQAAEFLYETSLFPDLEYTFKHALTHEVTYGSLLQERRRGLHARIVKGIETLYRDRLGEQVERLAHHACAGELWEEAIGFLHQAGTRASAGAAHTEAVIRFEQALAALVHLPSTEAWLARAIDLRLDLRNALFQVGDTKRTLVHLREAEAIAKRIGDDVRQARVLAHLSAHAWATGHNADALDLGKRAHAIASRGQSLQLRLHTAARLMFTYFSLGRYDRAIEIAEEHRIPLDSHLVYDLCGHLALPSVHFRSFPALVAAERGGFDSALRLATEAVEIAKEAEHLASQQAALWPLGVVLLLKGDLDRAIAVLEQGVGLADEAQSFMFLGFLMPHLSVAQTLTGRPNDILPRLEAFVEKAETNGFFHFHPLRLLALGQCYLAAGRIADAGVSARSALEMARRQGEKAQEAWILRLLGEIASHREGVGVEAAKAHYDQASILARELGMRPLVAHCHLGLGRIYRRTGKPEQAQEHLTIATTMYREMGMPFWLAQAEAAMKD
jgi:class 3 adenylate cyclase/tetratricopeptide (TPR) repeat protein